MKNSFFLLVFSVLLISSAMAGDQSLDYYLSNFDYAERLEMKISNEELISLLKDGKVQLIDIRFKEEFEVWHLGIAKNIPINELPKRLNELDKNKIIVTACPHKDRAIMARTFLKLKGFKSKYLKDGLIGLAEHLRGDKAKDFMQQISN